MDSKSHEQLDRLVRLEKLRLLRNLFLGAGLVAYLIAFDSLGGWSIANPKTWSSAYSAFAGAGMLRWAFLPVLGIGAALLSLGVFFTILVARRQR